MKKAVKIYNENGDETASIYSVKRKGDKLIMNGKVLGTMQMDMVLNSTDAVRALKLFFTKAVISFAIMLPYYALKKSFEHKTDV
jgi:hypothetical protein